MPDSTGGPELEPPHNLGEPGARPQSEGLIYTGSGPSPLTTGTPLSSWREQALSVKPSSAQSGHIDFEPRARAFFEDLRQANPRAQLQQVYQGPGHMRWMIHLPGTVISEVELLQREVPELMSDSTDDLADGPSTSWMEWAYRTEQVYHVRDARLAGTYRSLYVQSVRRRRFLFVGSYVRVEWRGNFPEAANRLAALSELRTAVLLRGDIRVRAHSRGFWAITGPEYQRPKYLWPTYVAIGQILLTSDFDR